MKRRVQTGGRHGCGLGSVCLFIWFVPFAQIVAVEPNGDELPASAETGLFGGGLFALEAPTLQPP